MRLINADELFHVVAGHHDLYKGATLRTDKARRDELLQVMVDINDAPTIDAIPVEWLEHMMTATTLARTSNAIKDVLALWNRMGQQEQETRTEF